MAKSGKSNSPSNEPRDDEEISLDEADERTTARPRLPDQRRDKRQFEISAPAGSAAGPAEPTTSPIPIFTPEENVLASSDEIEEYDPSVFGEDPPAVAAKERNEPAPAPAAPAKAARETSNELDDLDEFIARAASQSPGGEQPRKRQPYTLVEKVCFGGGLLMLLSLAVWLIRAAASEANAVPNLVRPYAKVPMEGSLITVSAASSSWRHRTDKDRVAEMEVILPIPQHQMPELIPQVEFTLDSGASKNGYLRFIFRDSYGKPRGDTRVVQVENGALKDMGKGEIISSSTQGSVYCSEGMQNLHAYHSYEADDVPRWSVEVSESVNYGAADKDWKILGQFQIRNDLK